jgi:nicotinamidase-related amidase
MRTDAPGKAIEPFSLVQWDLVPGHTAVVVIDPQNDFLHEEGWYARSGVDISHMRRTIGPIRQLVGAARARNVPIIWTRHGFRDERDAGVFFRLRPFLKDGGLRVGTWGYQILDECGAEPGDWYVEKNRLSAFYNTNLETILRGLDADTVLFAGVLTNQCVAASSKDANFRDFRPIVVEECTGTTLPHLHAPAIEMMKVGWAEVRSLSDTLTELDRMPIANTRSAG